MKIALAQINTTVGDFDGNARLILESSIEARSRGAELCLFPEQCIPGYPAHDLVERASFIDRNLETLDLIRRQVEGIAVIVGFAERSGKAWGKGLHNSAALISNREIVSVQRKSLLPTYDVFDESRYFEPGDEPVVADLNGVKFGVTICEDVWNDPEFWSRRLYARNPVEDLVRQGAEIIVNIAASPFTIEKRTIRREMLRSAAISHQRPLLFVNSVGGNDELVFDGSSAAFGKTGETWAQGLEFASDLVIVDTDTGSGDLHPLLGDDDEAALEALVLGTRDYARKVGFKSAVLGLSGGVDSALVLTIAARALGAENVEGVLMPSKFSSRGSITDSLELAKNLGVKTRIIPIDNLLDGYLADLEQHFAGRPMDAAEENIQARIRGNLVMALSNKFGHLVLSTGNKSEMATGYCTLYGDMAGGLAILSDTPKTMVYRICRVINREKEIIPQAILDKAPSAELRLNQCDQDSLPPYEVLDDIIERHVIGGLDRGELIESGFDATTVDQVLRLIQGSEYKRRQAAPGLKLTSKAFGYGRRIPLAQRWRS